MNYLKMSRTAFLGMLLIAGMIGCASSGGGTSSLRDDSGSRVSNSNRDMSLADHLRRLSGVRVYGTGDNVRVRIRGPISITEPDRQPLFVINGREVGRDYSTVSLLVRSRLIKSVKAIPSSRAAEYGIRGGGGVIEIEAE